MHNEFSEIGAFLDEGNEARHFYFEDYHLWTWVDANKSIVKFEFAYNNWRVKYSQGEFTRGSENYIGPMFLIVDERFGADLGIRAKLLAIRDAYNESLSPPMGVFQTPVELSNLPLESE
jgi:hypothetical protein